MAQSKALNNVFKLHDITNVKEPRFGAVGDGVANDTTAIQAAIDALEVIGNGVLLFPAGTYLIDTGLTVNKPILLIGDGQLIDSAADSGVAGGTVIKWNSGAAGTMLRFISLIANQRLWDAGSLGICYDGNNVAANAVRASSISRCRFDLYTTKVTTAGLTIDDANGVLSQFNDIYRLQHVYGSVAGVEGSHGLVMDGSVSDVGVTVNTIYSVSGLIKNGYMVFLKDCDGNHFLTLHASRAIGGTGGTLRLANGDVRPARNNAIEVIWGGAVVAESLTYGNRINDLHSEAGSVTINAGGQLHYRTHDYINAERWDCHSFVMSDQLLVMPGQLSPEEEFIAAPTFNPGLIADGAGVETDVTVTGCVLGDIAEASHSTDTQGVNLDAQVTADNVVTVRYQNETGGAITITSGSLRVKTKAHPTRVAHRGLAGDLWDSIAFDQDFDCSTKGSIAPPYHWSDGNITGVKLSFCMSAVNTTDQVRVRVRAITVTPLSSLSTPEVDESTDITVDDNALRVQEATLTFGTPLAYVKGQYIGLRIGRTGNHANDTAAGTMHLLGVHLLYEGEGPDSAGSGPFGVPPIGV
jgi:hypothetical protein